MDEKWGILEKKWTFYQFIKIFPNSADLLVEWLVFFHIYLLAAWLAIREALFDRNEKILKIKSELFSSPKWTGGAQKAKKNSRNILLVGADGTIGIEILKLLREHDDFECHVVVHRRNSSRKFERIVNNEQKIHVYEVDLIDKEQILLLASKLKSVQFEVSIFAAGIMLFPEFRTNDGVEMHNAVNVVGQLMLFELLDTSRAVFLSSATSRMACYSKEDLLSVYAGPYQAYASSKLNLAVYVNEMAKRRGISAVSLHPGTVPGRLYRFANALVQFLNVKFLPKVLRKPEIAAALVLHTVFREDFNPGGYYEDTELVGVTDWMPQEERKRIYETVHRRIEMWMER